MPTQVQFRRGTTTQTNSFTGAAGEITIDTTKNTVVVHDGSTAGGFPLALEISQQDVFAFAKANAAFDTANTGFDQANTAFDAANTVASNLASANTWLQANDSITLTVAQNYTDSANTKMKSYVDTANTNMKSYVDVANTSMKSYVDTANTNMKSYVDTNVTLIGGINSTQNTSISNLQTYSQGAFGQANAAFTKANSAYSAAVGANDAAIAADIKAQNAYNQANTGTTLAQNAYNSSNTVASNLATANTWLQANDSITLTAAQSYTDSANTKMKSYVDVANTSMKSYVDTANTNMKSYVDTANTFLNNAKVNKSGDTITGQLIINSTNGTALAVTGNVSISQDLTVSGNLIIKGNTTSISANNLVVDDSILYIANTNPGNSIDIGVVGNFTSTYYQHTGIIRDATDGKWKVFSNVVSEPTTTVDFTNAVYDTLKVGTIEAATANINNVNLLSFTQAAFIQANSAYVKANTAGVQSVTSNSSSRITQNSTTGNVQIDLATTGISAGTYTYPSVAVDVYGRVTTISSQTPVTSFNGLTGAVTLSSANVVSALTYTPANKAGDVFSGNIQAPVVTANTGLVLGASTIGYVVPVNYTTSSTTQVAIDTFAVASYRSAKYEVQMTSGTSYHVIELRVVHDGTTTWLVQYGEIITGSSLGTFDTDISAGNVRLLFTAANAVTEVRMIRNTISV